jgi:hypothetical protein
MLGRNGTSYAIKKATGVRTGDLCAQGYPYYSGKTRYTATFDVGGDHLHAALTLGRYDGVSMVVTVNDKLVKTLGWPSGPIDISGYIIEGTNTIALTLANSLQNMLGPHGSQADQHLVHPGSFYIYNGRHEVYWKNGFSGLAHIDMMHFEP